MGYRSLFELGSFDELGTTTRCWLVLHAVYFLTAVNVRNLMAHPETPPLYTSGVRYRPQRTIGGAPTGDDVDLWWDIPIVRAMGEGSCEDLAAWRIAELQARGSGLERSAQPYVHSIEHPTGTVYHVVVRYGGREEDPSVHLGMPLSPWMKGFRKAG